jgi:hypothetical protein
MAGNFVKNLEALAGGSMGAALVTSLVLFAFIFVFTGPQNTNPLYALVYTAIVAIICFAIAGTAGLAWHAFAQSKRWTSVHAYWTPAALLGILIPSAFLLPGVIANRGTDTIAQSLLLMLVIYGAALGGLTGLFAWLIRRPDRDAGSAL